MLPTDHWYVQAAYRIIRGGMLAKNILNEIGSANADALLPVDEVLYASREDVEHSDDVHTAAGDNIARRKGTRDEARRMALKEPVRWMRTFLTVESVHTETVDGIVKKIRKPFDLDGPDARSQYQKKCYGGFLQRWADDDPYVPAKTLRVRGNRVIVKEKLATDKHYVGRTKPRQVGSTTLGKKFSVLCGVSIDGWSTLLHFPESGDARAHLRDVVSDIESLNATWPELFPPIVVRNFTDGYVELANGSCWQTRHGDTKGGGVSKVGRNWNLVILSEAGKYELKGANVWSSINQAILPAVHASTRNVILWEGTNDAQAHELNRIALKGYVDFQFFGWDCCPAYIGNRVVSTEQQMDPSASYADFTIAEDGEPQPVSEFEYCQTHHLLPEQVGFRRRKIDELEDLLLVHREFPLTYEESLGLVAGGFFMKIQKHRAPDRIVDLNWSSTDMMNGVQSVHKKVVASDTLRGIWYMWNCECVDDGDSYYAVAGDFSDGLPSSDYTMLGAACVSCGQLRAAVRARLDHERIADEMAKCVSLFGNSRTWVIGELNGPGKAVMMAWERYGHGLNYTQKRSTKGYQEDTESVWFLTTSASRDPALIAMRKAYQSYSIIVPDARFEWDAEGFVKDSKGKYRALVAKSERTGERYMDDYVLMIAFLWELITWMRFRGYGADSESVVHAERVDRTMVASMSPKIQGILKKHMEIRR